MISECHCGDKKVTPISSRLMANDQWVSEKVTPLKRKSQNISRGCSACYRNDPVSTILVVVLIYWYVLQINVSSAMYDAWIFAVTHHTLWCFNPSDDCKVDIWWSGCHRYQKSWPRLLTLQDCSSNHVGLGCAWTTQRNFGPVVRRLQGCRKHFVWW